MTPTNPLGVCTWVWTAGFTDADADLGERATRLGFSVLEVCVEQTAGISPARLRDVAERTGVAYTVCGAFGPDRDLAGDAAGPRQAALDYIAWCAELAAAIGAGVVCGPMYSSVGRAPAEDRAARRTQWRRSVDGLKRAADHAAGLGVTLAIEPLNRYETDMVNTTEQGLALCADVGADNVGLLLDTYHMNIEEKSIGAAILDAGDRLRHFHACENDRGTPGSGHVRWPEVFSALADNGYGGPIVIESFTPQVREIARAVSLWRDLDADGDELAAGGRAFLARGLATAGA